MTISDSVGFFKVICEEQLVVPIDLIINQFLVGQSCYKVLDVFNYSSSSCNSTRNLKVFFQSPGIVLGKCHFSLYSCKTPGILTNMLRQYNLACQNKICSHYTCSLHCQLENAPSSMWFAV